MYIDSVKQMIRTDNRQLLTGLEGNINYVILRDESCPISSRRQYVGLEGTHIIDDALIPSQQFTQIAF